MLPVDNGIRTTRGFDRYDMSNFDTPINFDFIDDSDDRDITPPSSSLPSGVSEYRTYYYEVADLNSLGSGLSPNFAYTLYPPSANSGQFFDFTQVMRLQDGYSSRSNAVVGAKAWIDGLVGGINDPGDEGDSDGIGGINLPPIDIDFPDPPTQEQIQESIDNGSSVPESSEPMGQFAVVGIVMIGFLGYLFYEAFKKGE